MLWGPLVLVTKDSKLASGNLWWVHDVASHHIHNPRTVPAMLTVTISHMRSIVIIYMQRNNSINKLCITRTHYIHNNVEYNEQWHSQTQYMLVGHNLSLLTALIEYLTVLLEYIDKIINI